jgi:hypothetical protein
MRIRFGSFAQRDRFLILEISDTTRQFPRNIAPLNLPRSHEKPKNRGAAQDCGAQLRLAWPQSTIEQLSKDYEYSVQSSETLIEIAATRLMLNRLA